MKLVQKIESNKLLSSDWGIYELSDEEQKKFGKKFALSQGVFCDHAMETYGSDNLISELSPYKYEGLFDTQLEAYFQVKLVEMECKIQRFENLISNLVDVKNIETPYWREYELDNEENK